MSDTSRRKFLEKLIMGSAAIGTSGLWSGFKSSRSSNPPDRPNIILFISDDHAKMDAGCYGNEAVRTPNIDRLAGEGMRFERAFTVTPTCVPSRASTYSGLGPFRHGAHENHSTARPDLKTLPHYFNELGYQTILAGKTHIRPTKAYPFDRYIDTKGDWNATIVKEGSEVVRFLQEEASDARPFCLVIATNDPHVPWSDDHDYDPADVKLHPFLLDTPETRQAMANYYNDVTKMDRELGRTLDVLDRSGLSENTLFVYTSDHGPQFPHAKWELYDYGINVPFIVRWPGKVKPGSVTRAMISSVDTLPTLMEAAGGSAPDDIDGESFLPVLTGEAQQHRSEIYATHTRDTMMNYFPIRAVRTENYKYIWNLAPERAYTTHLTNERNFIKNGGGHLWDSWMKLANEDPRARERVAFFQHRPEVELYNVQRDPSELNNLAGDNGMQPVKNKLAGKLKQWMKQQGDEGRDEWDY